MSKLVKPTNIENDAFRSAKWDELTAGRDFSQADAPTLALLVSWYQVIEQCMDNIGANGGVQVAYQNDAGDIKALPQLSRMKQASAEVRALSRQLRISDEPARGRGAPRGRPCSRWSYPTARGRRPRPRDSR